MAESPEALGSRPERSNGHKPLVKRANHCSLSPEVIWVAESALSLAATALRPCSAGKIHAAIAVAHRKTECLPLVYLPCTQLTSPPGRPLSRQRIAPAYM